MNCFVHKLAWNFILFYFVLCRLLVRHFVLTICSDQFTLSFRTVHIVTEYSQKRSTTVPAGPCNAIGRASDW